MSSRTRPWLLSAATGLTLALHPGPSAWGASRAGAPQAIETGGAAGAAPALPASLAEVVVVGVRPPAPAVDGAHLLAGKRVTQADLERLPPIEGQTLRQALAPVPGLVISEVSNGSWASLSFRGLGEPHESWNLLTLQDGIPIVPDPYSYPAAYSIPPLDTVGQVRFIRGGAGLLFGPQPGGALDYRSPPLPHTPGWRGGARLSAGSSGRIAGVLQADGQTGALAGRAFVSATGSDGPRHANSDSQTTSAGLRVRLGTGPTTLELALNGYRGRFGEPGGLSRSRFDADPRGVSTPLDRLLIERLAPSATLRWQPDAGRHLSLTVVRSDFERTSWRQAGGSFGTVTPADNVLVRQTQLFSTGMLDVRFRQDFGPHSWTAGGTAFTSDAPVRVDKGAGPSDRTGSAGILARADRTGRAGAVFSELRLVLGDVDLVPGVRLERIGQTVTERIDNTLGSLTGGPPGGPNGPPGSRRSDETVLLWGLGASWRAGAGLTWIGNVSTGYKPRLFNDGVTFQSGVDAAGDLAPTRSLIADLGVRLEPRPWLRAELAGFAARLEDQVGFLPGPLPAAGPSGAVAAGGARRQTVGTLRNHGLDLSVEADLFGPSGGLLDSTRTRPDRLGLMVAGQLLDAGFTAGPARGQRPQYAPEYLVRLALAWEHPDGRKIAVFATGSAAQSGADSAAPEFAIPAHRLVDLLVEWPLGAGVALTFAASNLTNERFVARIRPGGGGGIDPGLPRTISAGLRLRLPATPEVRRRG